MWLDSRIAIQPTRIHLPAYILIRISLSRVPFNSLSIPLSLPFRNIIPSTFIRDPLDLSILCIFPLYFVRCVYLMQFWSKFVDSPLITPSHFDNLIINLHLW